MSINRFIDDTLTLKELFWRRLPKKAGELDRQSRQLKTESDVLLKRIRLIKKQLREIQSEYDNNGGILSTGGAIKEEINETLNCTPKVFFDFVMCDPEPNTDTGVCKFGRFARGVSLCLN